MVHAAANTLEFQASHEVYRDYYSAPFTVTFTAHGGRLNVRWWSRDQGHLNARAEDVVAVAFYPLAPHRGARYVMSLWGPNATTNAERALLGHTLLYDIERRNGDADQDPAVLSPPGWNSRVREALMFPKAALDRSVDENLWATRLGWHIVRHEDDYLVASPPPLQNHERVSQQQLAFAAAMHPPSD